MTRHLTYPPIMKVLSIVTGVDDERLPNRVEIEVQTSLGRGLLVMSQHAAAELAEKLPVHLQAGAR